jgi:uncharacterized protein (UPF0335 family)
MTNWRPIKNLDELDSIESRLSRDRKIVVANIPGEGLCYKVVRKIKPIHKRKPTKVIY